MPSNWNSLPASRVLTGETGAGKSILIDALTLALGGRGDASVVREGAAKADISADFAVGEPPPPGWPTTNSRATRAARCCAA